jgi:hypothetical protein
MKTRTLLLLALGCGVAILAAGTVLLLQLTGRDAAEPPTPIGVPAEVGDLGITVLEATEAGGRLAVAVEIGGVDDPAALEDLRVVASGRPAPRVSDDDPAPSATGLPVCTGVTVAVTSCVVVFDVASADGSARVLVVERGDERVRWDLAA